MNAYCLKCRKTCEMKSGKNTTLKNGRSAVKGVCVKCGTKMMKFVSGNTKNAKKSRSVRKSRGTRKRKTASKKK